MSSPPHSTQSLEPQSDTQTDDVEDQEEQLTIPQSIRRGGGPKRKSQKKPHPLQAKKSRELQQILKTNLKLVPFKPSNPINIASHETLLKKLSLYEFVSLNFEQCVRIDLICELIANWKPDRRCSSVKGVKIGVNRADLARALRLPAGVLKKENVAAAPVEKSEENVEVVEQVMNNYVLLHDDMWMMPAEVLNWGNLIKDGSFERIDWARMVWFMVEKELLQGSSLEKCYYASHLQALIRNQKPELMSSAVEESMVVEEEEDDGSVRMEIVEDDDKEEDCREECGDGDDVVRASEDFRVEEMEEHNIELSLGGMDGNNSNVGREEGEKEGKEAEMVMVDGNSMDVEEKKEEDGHGGHWQSNMDGHFLQRCNLGNVGIVECGDGEGERQQNEGQNEGVGYEDGKEGEDDDDDDEEEEDEEEGHDELGFSISPKGNGLDGICSENLLDAMEASQFPFTSGMQIHDSGPSSEFLASRVDTQTIPGSSSQFGIANKRVITHLDNDVSHHSHSGANKRMRNDAPWEMKQTSEIDLCWEQMQHAMGKVKMLYEAKEQAVQEMSMNQQMWASQLQQRDELLQHLHKVRLEEQQRRQEVYRLDRELEMMVRVVEGYRKALKATHKAFAEYRVKHPSPEQPLYKDAGPGGLVLTNAEFEKQRQKREEEEMMQLLLCERKIKEFETSFVTKFDSFKEMVSLLDNKLTEAAKEIDILKERFAKQKEMVSEPAEENVSKPEE